MGAREPESARRLSESAPVDAAPGGGLRGLRGLGPATLAGWSSRRSPRSTTAGRVRPIRCPRSCGGATPCRRWTRPCGGCTGRRGRRPGSALASDPARARGSSTASCSSSSSSSRCCARVTSGWHKPHGYRIDDDVRRRPARCCRSVSPRAENGSSREIVGDLRRPLADAAPPAGRRRQRQDHRRRARLLVAASRAACRVRSWRPTELLAEQHFGNLSASPRPALPDRALTGSSRRGDAARGRSPRGEIESPSAPTP